MLKHTGTVTIETPRLILRRATLADRDAMFENWASDPEVTKYLTWPAHSSPAVSQQVLESWIAGYEQDDYYQWIITLKEQDGEPIGSICATSIDDRIGKTTIGYCLGKKWWHRGIMSETLAAVMAHLFEQVGMNRVESRHDPNNPRSGAVMRSCSMTYEGTFRQADWNNQGICDACIYATLASDWRKDHDTGTV